MRAAAGLEPLCHGVAQAMIVTSPSSVQKGVCIKLVCASPSRASNQSAIQPQVAFDMPCGTCRVCFQSSQIGGQYQHSSAWQGQRLPGHTEKSSGKQWLMAVQVCDIHTPPCLLSRLNVVQDKLIDPTSIVNLFKVTPKIGMLVTGFEGMFCRNFPPSPLLLPLTLPDVLLIWDDLEAASLEQLCCITAQQFCCASHGIMCPHHCVQLAQRSGAFLARVFQPAFTIESSANHAWPTGLLKPPCII